VLGRRVDEQHGDMAPFLELGDTDDPFLLRVGEHQIVLRHAHTEPFHRGDTAEGLDTQCRQ